MNTSKLFTGIGITLALILSVIAVTKDSPVASQPQQQFGGTVAGVTNTSGYWDYNGFQEYFLNTPMATATSTLCAIRSPRATSTLIAFYANISANSDSAGGTFYLATSTTQFATTTNLFAGTIPAGTALGATTTVSWIATTTDTTAQKWTVPSGSFVMFDLKGKTSYNITGKCYAEFRAFQ